MAIKDKLQSIFSGKAPDGPAPEPKKRKDKNEPARKIGSLEIANAAETLRIYRAGKANLENRIIDNEQWWKMRHWEQIRAQKNLSDPEPASAWLFNSIANKHADAMDNYPEPNVLPREKSDKTAADQLSRIIPVVLERNQFEETYSDVWWYKLKAGTGAYGVFWNKTLENGLGDIDIRKMDILNLFWAPGVTDIQDSPHFFNVALVDRDVLRAQYPDVELPAAGDTGEVSKYIHDDTIDTSEKLPVIDWYYKIRSDTGSVLHYCKFVHDVVLFASENEPEAYENGYYEHGDYPFELDPLFPVESSPCGFGEVDIMKDAQLYIDKLNQVVMKNAVHSARPRYFIKSGGDINEAEYADLTKDFIHVNGAQLGEDSLRPVDTPELPPIVLSVLQMKIDELKETSGNRDFSQGGTTSGVTAASAIAALQEAGSKLSRDRIKASYRTFQRICYLCIELIRQFYDEPRAFRITGESGEREFTQFSNAAIAPQAQGTEFGEDLGFRRPVFDIKVTSQRASPFSKVAQNELAKEMYGAGFFNPQLADQALSALEMMDFEGKDMVIRKVSQNGTLFQQVQQLQQQMQKLAVLVDNAYGSQMLPAMMQEMGAQGGQPAPSLPDGSGPIDTNPLGEAQSASESSAAAKARVQAAGRSTPKA